MARLFGNEYHEHSNTWYFRSSVKTLKQDELEYSLYKDENGHIVFNFSAVSEDNPRFPGKITILYDAESRKILSHECTICSQDDTCPHYLTILEYTYRFLSTDILQERVIQTYQTRLLQYNEYWQRILLNTQISVSGIYDTNDKVRFYFRYYKPIDIRLISMIVADRDLKDATPEEIELANTQMDAFTNEELTLLKMLQEYKCSFSRTSNFFTIYKRDFYHFIPMMRILQSKIFVKETGDRILFENEPYQISFLISPIDQDSFLFSIAPGETISAYFVNRLAYIFIKNTLHHIQLPFKKEITEKILGDGYILRKEDLVYFASVVTHQLSLIRCYLDFDETIELPDLYDGAPVPTFMLSKLDNSILMEGILNYAENVPVPMSVIYYPAELVRYDQNQRETWFYIPPQIRYQIDRFLEKLPQASAEERDFELKMRFEGEEEIDMLKKTIFEETDPSWNIQLSEELKKEFIYKVTLQPTIRAKTTDQIDWFEYEVTYQYKDLIFTHEDLKKFFKRKEKFLKLEDGRLLYFTNQDTFRDVERLMKRSQKSGNEYYKLSVYNIPYIYQLTSIREGIQIQGDEYLQNMFEAILARKLDDDAPIPRALSPVMRSYQKSGFHWLKMLQNFHLGGILADDMGLGKTIQAISILSELPTNSMSLVICPKTLLFNWAAEIEKFNPSLKYIIYEGNKEERAALLENSNVQVFIASYSIIMNDLEELQSIYFNYVILDEAQHIKNAGALRSKAIKKLNARFRLALTGTPMENNPTELWSIFDFLLPGYLPSPRKFKAEYVSPLLEKHEKHEHLAALISPFILRRKKKDVLIELPDKQEQISYCRMSTLQEKLYVEVIESVKKNFINRFNQIDTGNYIHVLAALTRLRQICNHPALVQKDLKSQADLSGKMEQLMIILEDAIESGRKVLVFSQFVETLKLIRQYLSRKRIVFEYMDGDTKARHKRVDNFNNNANVRAFLISLKTGGFGLNLTAADTVVLVDPWWNPMGENQAIDRAHRIGQTKKVNVYKLITLGTVEEKILNLQRDKIEMFENIIEGGQNILRKLDVEELRNLFEYTAGEGHHEELS